jgi:hypothetical protein
VKRVNPGRVRGFETRVPKLAFRLQLVISRDANRVLTSLTVSADSTKRFDEGALSLPSLRPGSSYCRADPGSSPTTHAAVEVAAEPVAAVPSA